jgi:molybdate transport system regulatory protein
MVRTDEKARTVGGFEVRSKVWVEKDGKVALSSWRIELLSMVEETGSLAAACERMAVPYRTAWYKLREIEDELGMKLLETQSGGADGGGSALTPEARDLVSRFRRVDRGIEEIVEKRFASELGGLIN